MKSTVTLSSTHPCCTIFSVAWNTYM